MVSHYFAGIALILIGMSSMGTSIYSLIPLVLRDLVGSDNLTTAMGMQMMFQAGGGMAAAYLSGTGNS